MNERIKELKKQAWEYAMAVHDGHIVPPLNKEVWPLDEVFDEKFAELIVKETTNAIIKGHKGHINPALARESANKHFGVEE